eukprot:5912557-Prymnesium_polylepis.1
MRPTRAAIAIACGTVRVRAQRVDKTCARRVWRSTPMSFDDVSQSRVRTAVWIARDGNVGAPAAPLHSACTARPARGSGC